MGKIISLIITFAVILFVVKNLPAPVKKNIVEIKKQGEKMVSESPYSVSALRKKEFKGSEIEVEQELGDFGAFKSSIVSYQSDGLKIYTLMNVPTSEKPVGGFPVLILNHGYINPEVYSTADSYRKSADLYASRGFIVLKPDYRAHGKSEGQRNQAINRINYTVDVLNLIASVKNLANANENKIVMYGHSLGGEVTLRALEVTDKVKAATLWAPATTVFPESFFYFIRKNRPNELEGNKKELEKIINQADYLSISTIHNLHHIKTPLIIHHGTSDESVPFAWGEDLDKKLTEKKIEHIFYKYEGEDHNFTQGAVSTVFERDINFFNSKLKGKD